MKIIEIVLIFLLTICFIVGFSAFGAWIVMLLWNYVVVAIRHPELQVQFWVAWAATTLLGIIASPFRSTRTTTSTS